MTDPRHRYTLTADNAAGHARVAGRQVPAPARAAPTPAAARLVHLLVLRLQFRDGLRARHPARLRGRGAAARLAAGAARPAHGRRGARHGPRLWQRDGAHLSAELGAPCRLPHQCARAPRLARARATCSATTHATFAAVAVRLVLALGVEDEFSAPSYSTRRRLPRCSARKVLRGARSVDTEARRRTAAAHRALR